LIIAAAMSCGLPVLTLDRGSLKELVADGVSGYVCDDISGLEKVLKEGCLASIKSENCVKTAASFSKEAMAQAYLALFQQVRLGGLW
jgi:glycosyltransferase involved in cell wall biosynthesis